MKENFAEKFVVWTSEIDEALRRGIVWVKYEKRDGTIRAMKATLSEIPEEKQPKGVKVYDHTKIVRVFDVEKNDWRTINKESVIEWHVEG